MHLRGLSVYHLNKSTCPLTLNPCKNSTNAPHCFRRKYRSECCLDRPDLNSDPFLYIFYNSQSYIQYSYRSHTKASTQRLGELHRCHKLFCPQAMQRVAHLT